MLYQIALLIPFIDEFTLNIKMRIVIVIISEKELLTTLLQRNGIRRNVFKGLLKITITKINSEF